MYRTERVFIVSALLAAGMAVIAALGHGLAGSIGFASIALLMATALVVLAAAGALWVTAFEPVPGGVAVAEPRLPFSGISTRVIIPALLALGLALFVLLFDNVALQSGVVVLGGLAFGAVYWAQTRARSTADTRLALAQTALNVGGHLTAFLVFSVIYGLKIRSLYSAGAVGIVGSLLLYELLARDAAWHDAMQLPTASRRSMLGFFALVGGLVMAELTWGLNYWAALSTLVGGAFLLLAFYVTYGLIVSYVDGRLTRQVYVEFASVAAVGLVAIFASAFFS